MGLPPRFHLNTPFRVMLGLAVATLALAACTADADPPADAEGSPQTSPPPVTSTDSYVFTDAAGIEARITIEEEGAVLTVENDTGGTLPRPGVYVLDARDGTRVDWTVVEAAALSEGESEFRSSARPCPSPSTSDWSCCCSGARTTARSCRRGRETRHEGPSLARRFDRDARGRRRARRGARAGSTPLGCRRPRRCARSSRPPRAPSRPSCSSAAGVGTVPIAPATSSCSPPEPDFVGTGGLPHSGPWDYVGRGAAAGSTGPGTSEARGG